MAIKKVRRRKFNFIKFLKFILFLTIIIFSYITISKIPIKNILILNNNKVTDEEIIEIANIEKYPSFIKTSSKKIKKKIENLPLIEEVKIKKRWGFILEIEVTEHKVLFLQRSTNELILNNNVKLDNKNLLINAPILINYVPDDTLKKMIKKFELIEESILTKISEIEYTPTTYDNERFLLYMIDGNIVYITLNKTKELGKYNKIKKELGGKKGILYLDSGNYFEIKE